MQQIFEGTDGNYKIECPLIVVIFSLSSISISIQWLYINELLIQEHQRAKSVAEMNETSLNVTESPILSPFKDLFVNQKLDTFLPLFVFSVIAVPPIAFPRIDIFN